MRSQYAKPAILATIPRDRHVVIEASAGTGKTYTIEHLVVDLLMPGGVTIEEILVLTFTERAAAELRKRIRGVLVKILDDTGAEAGDGGAFWPIDDRVRKKLTRALLSLDKATIGTIHGFFTRVLNEHAFASGRLFDATLADGRTLFGRAFKTALRNDLARQQSQAAPLLALWLDQSTTGITDLEDWLYKLHETRRDIRPGFDVQALRREIEASPLARMIDDAERDRLAASLKAAKINGTILKNTCTRHLPLVNQALAGWKGDLTALMDAEFLESLRYLALNFSKLSFKSDAPVIADAAARMNRLVVPLEAAVVQTCLPVIREELAQQMASSGVYDFDAIVAGVAAALDGPGGAELIRSLRNRYKYALIDEFQDTDELQWKVFRQVFTESPTDHRAYLIGDPKQAIYGFRGADVRTYLAARRTLVPPGQTPIELRHNFRSTAALIEACNQIFDQNDDEPFFEDAEINFQHPAVAGRGQDHSALNADGTPSVPVHVLKLEPTGKTATIGELRRGLERQIAREARGLLSEPGSLKIGKPGAEGPIKPKDIFVLSATNPDALKIVAALREAGVRSALYKQDGLFQTSEAREVRDLLAAIDDPDDPARRGRAWITPFFSVPLDVLPELDELSASNPLVERLNSWKEMADARRFEILFARILDDSGIVLRELVFKDNERALTNYIHLFELLLEEARGNGCGLAELVATLDGYIKKTRQPPAEDGNVQRLESDQAAVQVMTIHKSKGLEAAVVFLYGGFTRSNQRPQHYHDGDRRVLDLDLTDARKVQAERERDQEDQRLYYVALTRAGARLYLPFVPPELWPSVWKGAYRRVNQRLARVLPRLQAEGLFTIRPFRDEPPDLGPVEKARPPETWRPAPKELHILDPTRDLARLRDRSRGYAVTSYSRMKQNWARSDIPIEPDEFYREPVPAFDSDAVPEAGLPGGRETGTLLHEILELVPFDLTAAAAGLDAWRELGPVARVVDEALTRSGIARAHRPEIEAIVYRALTTEIRPDGIGTIPGVCRCRQELREMEFVFPIPEAAHPRLSAPGTGRIRIERGFLKGFVDLVVEHEGRVYAVDWKSDVVDSYDPESVKKCVATHYDVQANLYALALVKALGIHNEAAYERRFGGMFYVFLRGLRQSAAEGAGVHFVRPPWHAILAYEEELIRYGEESLGGSR
jgi:exodeoxyribonuclease V beta subunit